MRIFQQSIPVLFTIIGIGILLFLGLVVLDTYTNPFRLCNQANWTGNITNNLGVSYDCVELAKINSSIAVV